MTLEEQALQLPKAEKLRLMELLWSDLSTDPSSLEPPAWHKQALLETEKRLAEGKEHFIEWEEAKKQLRQ